MSQDDLPSKTRRKQEMQALQDLGAALAELAPERIRSLALPETLEHALLEAGTLKTHGAIRRQLQYIGKLMRDVDPTPLREYLDRLTGTSHKATARFHQAERWRDRMMEHIGAVDEFVASHGQADRQQMRQLALGAQRERQAQSPPRLFRELFRAIARTLEAEPPPTEP